MLAALGLTNSFWVALVLLTFWAMIFAAEMPIRQAYLNDMIPSRQRATVLSFDSLMGISGGVVIQPVLGKVADVYSYSTSLVTGALIQLAAAPFLLRSRREGAPADKATSMARRAGCRPTRAAAPDVDHLTADVARVLRAQERDHPGDVLGLADSAERGLVGAELLEVLERNAEPVRGLLRHRGRDEARRDAVDVDLEPAELDRERLRHRLDPGLCGRVVELAAVAERRDRRDQHHLPAAVLGHVRLRRLGGEERAAQVGGDHRVPVVVAQLVDEVVADDPGARDQDVQAAELLDRAGDGGLDLLARGDVGLDLEAGDVVVEGEIGGRHLGALGGEPRQRRLPDPAAGAGDERDLALEAIHAA